MTWFNLLKIEDPGSVGGMTEWHKNAREFIEEIKELGAEVKIERGDEPNSNKLIVTGRGSIEINLYHPPIDSANEGRSMVRVVRDSNLKRNTDLPAIKFSTKSNDLTPGELYSIGVDGPIFQYSANTIAHYTIRMVGGRLHERAREMLDGVINRAPYAEKVGNNIIIKPDWLKTEELEHENDRVSHYKIDLSNRRFCVIMVFKSDSAEADLCLSPSGSTIPLDDYYATTILAAGKEATWKKMWPQNEQMG